jgi:hypothetical protein
MIEFDHSTLGSLPPEEKDPVPPVFIANADIQTIPSPDHPIGDEIVDWFIKGGKPPVEESMLPKNSLLGDIVPMVNQDLEVATFPAVVEAIDQARADQPESTPSRLQRVKEKFLNHIPISMRPGQEYNLSGD